MNTHTKNDQHHQHDEQTAALDTRVPYEPPQLTVMGKVENLTALLFQGVPDLLSHGNIL